MRFNIPNSPMWPMDIGSSARPLLGRGRDERAKRNSGEDGGRLPRSKKFSPRTKIPRNFGKSRLQRLSFAALGAEGRL